MRALHSLAHPASWCLSLLVTVFLWLCIACLCHQNTGSLRTTIVSFSHTIKQSLALGYTVGSEWEVVLMPWSRLLVLFKSEEKNKININTALCYTFQGFLIQNYSSSMKNLVLLFIYWWGVGSVILGDDQHPGLCSLHQIPLLSLPSCCFWTFLSIISLSLRSG